MNLLEFISIDKNSIITYIKNDLYYSKNINQLIDFTSIENDLYYSKTTNKLVSLTDKFIVDLKLCFSQMFNYNKTPANLVYDFIIDYLFFNLKNNENITNKLDYYNNK